jgi:copper homeostasis protein CutC
MNKKVLAETKKQYTVMIRPSVSEEYEKLAGKMFMTRSQLMANALEMALDDIHMLEALGVVRVVGGMVKAQKLVDEWRNRQEEMSQQMI